MEAIASESTARPRFRAQLVGSFATFAVVLAAFGVFSVLTFMVQQRSREFSLRLALGVSAGRLVAGSGCLLAMGVVLGLAASALRVRFLADLLFGVTPFDVVTVVAAPATLTLIALLACVAPGLRALRADPAVALREQ
jgi:putative ABC transport system permease protein